MAALAALSLSSSARAIESTALRWELWNLRPFVGVGEQPDPFWRDVVDQTRDTGLSSPRESTGASNGGWTLRWLPIQLVGSIQATAGPVDPVLPNDDGHRLIGPAFGAVSAGAQLQKNRIHLAAEFVGSARENFPQARLDQLRVEWLGGRHGWTLGRFKTRWGSGLGGSLLLGRDAPTRWQARWRTQRPLRVPFAGLRSTTWTWGAFLSYLDDDIRTIANPMLLGHRTGWQIRPWFEVSFTRTILFGGDGRLEKFSALDYLYMLLGINENEKNDFGATNSDHRASFEFRFRVPYLVRLWDPLEAVEYFYEYAGEDMIYPPIPAAVAHHHGLTAVIWGWKASYEWLSTNSGHNRWYRHIIFGDGYEYRGYPLGATQGGDARSVFLTLWTPDRAVQLRATGILQTFGIHSGNNERRLTGQLAVRVPITTGIRMEIEANAGERLDDARELDAPGFVERQVLLRFTIQP